MGLSVQLTQQMPSVTFHTMKCSNQKHGLLNSVKFTDSWNDLFEGDEKLC